MAENENVNHWQLLAAELGAEVPEVEEVPGKAEDVAREQSVPTAPADADAAAKPSFRRTGGAPLPPRPAPPRRTASDWGQLAQELGVEVPPEPEPSEPPHKEVRSTSVRNENVDRDVAAPAFEPPPGTRFEDESEEPRRSADRPERDEERRGRKRRRRRRPSGGPERAPAETTTETSPQAREWEGTAEAEVPEELDIDAEEAEPEAAPETAPSASAPREEGSRRGRRRRRRRGGSSGRESGAGDGARRSRGPSPERSDREVPEPATPEDDFADDLLDDDPSAEEEARGEKPVHRAIPSWLDAVNVVISANLESRAKTPDRKPGGRSRGGHDRRGRERSGERPS